MDTAPILCLATSLANTDISTHIKRSTVPGTMGASLSKMTNTLHKYFAPKVVTYCALGRDCRFEATDTCETCKTSGCSFHSDTLCPHHCQAGNCGATENLSRRCAACKLTLCASHTFSSCPHLVVEGPISCSFGNGGCSSALEASTVVSCEVCGKILCPAHGSSSCTSHTSSEPGQGPVRCAFLLSRGADDNLVTCMSIITRSCGINGCCKHLCEHHTPSPCPHVALCRGCGQHTEAMAVCHTAQGDAPCGAFLCSLHCNSPCPHNAPATTCTFTGLSDPCQLLCLPTLCPICNKALCELHYGAPCPHSIHCSHPSCTSPAEDFCSGCKATVCPQHNSPNCSHRCKKCEVASAGRCPLKKCKLARVFLCKDHLALKCPHNGILRCALCKNVGTTICATCSLRLCVGHHNISCEEDHGMEAGGTSGISEAMPSKRQASNDLTL